jgi:hypothetical protein
MPTFYMSIEIKRADFNDGSREEIVITDGNSGKNIGFFSDQNVSEANVMEHTAEVAKQFILDNFTHNIPEECSTTS